MLVDMRKVLTKNNPTKELNVCEVESESETVTPCKPSEVSIFAIGTFWVEIKNIQTSILLLVVIFFVFCYVFYSRWNWGMMVPSLSHLIVGRLQKCKIQPMGWHKCCWWASSVLIFSWSPTWPKGSTKSIPLQSDDRLLMGEKLQALLGKISNVFRAIIFFLKLIN